MPLTTNTDSEAGPGPRSGEVGKQFHSPSSMKIGGQSGYDVLTSAASPHEMGRPERWDRFILFNVAIPILLILSGVLVIRLLGKAEARPMPPPDTSSAAVLEGLPATRVERVRSLKETGQQLELIVDGTVVPFSEAVVASEVAGRVVEKSANCESGAIVTAGEVLMRIDPQDYSLEVQRLSNQREREYRAIGENDQEMANTRRLIKVAEQDVQLQTKELKRQTDLKSFASEAEVDRARSALLQANQQLVTLQNQLDLLTTRRSRLEAGEQLAATQLRVAEVNLTRCEIRAPISGVIVSEQADLNTFVNRGTALVTIEDTEKVEVASSMRMDQLHWVLDQEQTTARAGYDLPDTKAIIEYEVAGRQGAVQRWNGTLLSYDGIGIDPNTRTVPVRLVVDDPTHYVDQSGKEQVADRTNALLRGMFVRVRLQLQPRSELVVIPAKALRPGNRVWKFSPDEAVLQRRIAEVKESAAAKLASDPQSEALADQESEPEKAAGSEGQESKLTDPISVFDPSLWKAGLVEYSTTVYPIDSLRLSGMDEIDPNLAPSLQSPGRVWVCETASSNLTSGDYLVVSPLDSIPPDGLPARAKIEP